MTETPTYLSVRPRRLRAHPRLRDLVRETHLQVADFVQPLFIHHAQGTKTPISSMPGNFQLSVDQLAPHIDEIVQAKVPAVLLFGIPSHKDSTGSSALLTDGVIQQATRAIKQQAPDLLVIADLCLCEYTDHGHCGVMNEKTGRMDLDNDATLPLLVKQAVSLCQAGVDVIAPSGNLDGMVHALRDGLDQAGMQHIPLMSYAVKYASALYGPFREAAEGAPTFGDRRSYQMDSANANEALREARLDVEEGADFLMVKPAHTYLDIIYRIKQAHPEIPLAAYHVSGEYAMLKAAAEKKWLDEKLAVLETMVAIKRAGADIIITYYATQIARWILDDKS